MISPFKLYKYLKGITIHIRIGLPQRLAFKISKKYMWSEYYKKHIRLDNIKKSIVDPYTISEEDK